MREWVARRENPGPKIGRCNNERTGTELMPAHGCVGGSTRRGNLLSCLWSHVLCGDNKEIVMIMMLLHWGFQTTGAPCKASLCFFSDS